MSHGKHSSSAGWLPGEHWIECMRCGLDIRHSDSRKEWNGLIVCKECWEPRHPQDFVRAIPDDSKAKGNVYPPPADTFITVDSVAGSVGVQENTIPASTINNEI